MFYILTLRNSVVFCRCWNK